MDKAKKSIKYLRLYLIPLCMVTFIFLSVTVAEAQNYRPRTGTITPSSGSSSANQEVFFTTTYTDANGSSDIQSCLFMINTTLNANDCFYGLYRSDTNKLYIFKTGSRWIGGVTPGSEVILENDHAKLDCSKTTVSKGGNTVSVTWAATFKDTFAGNTCNMYLKVYDISGLGYGWRQGGTWEVEEQDPYYIKHLIGHGTFGNVNNGWQTQGIFWQNKIKIKDIDNDDKDEILFGNNQGFVHILEYKDNTYIDVWKSQCLGWLISGMATDDVDNDGDVEIIASDYRRYYGRLYFFNGKTLEQEGTIDLEYIFSLHTSDLDGDLIPEILASGTSTAGDGTIRRGIHIYDGKTKLEKGAIEISGIVRALNSIDLNGDSKKEIIAAIDTNLFIFDGQTGEEITHFENARNLYTLEIGDADNDGTVEIVTSDEDGYIYALTFDNETQRLNEKWSTSSLGGPIYSLKLDDLEDDGNTDIIASAGNRLYIYDGVEWKSRDFISNIFDLAIGDPDGDGAKEIFLGLDVGYLYVFDARDINNTEWQEIGGRFYTLEVADIDNDGELEYITGNEMGFVYVFEGRTNGYEQLGEKFNEGVTGIATHDINEDGVMEVLISASDGVHVFDGITKQGWPNVIGISRPEGVVVDDLNQDKHVEISTYSSNDRFLYALNVITGSMVWRNYFSNNISYRSFKVANIDDDSDMDLAVTTTNVLNLFNARTGAAKWQSKISGESDIRGLISADIDDNGTVEVITQTHHKNYGLSIFNGCTGKLECEPVKGLDFKYGLAVGDVDSDPSLEIVVANGYADWVGFRFIDGHTKEIKHNSGSLGELVGHRGAMQVVDIDSDGKNEIIAGSDGYVIIYATPGTNPKGSDLSRPLVYIGIEDDTVVSGTVDINVQATDNTVVSKIELYVDEEFIETLNQSSYQWALDTTKYSEGRHILKVLAYDLAGNIGTEEVRIGIDNNQPQPPTVLGATSPTYLNPLAIGGTKSAYTNIWINGEEVVSFNNNDSWLAFVYLTEGPNFFNIIAKSYSGKESVVVPLHIFLDSTAPQLPQVEDDGLTTDYLDRLHARWFSGDPETGIVKYLYAIGTQEGGTDVLDWTDAGSATEVTVVDLRLVNGQKYHFAVKAKNGACNWSQVGISDGITVDHQPPEIDYFEPPKFKWFVAGEEVNISVSAIGTQIEYRISIDEQVVSDWSDNTSYPWQTDTSDFGRHTIKVEAEDNKGGRVEEAIPIFIRHEVIDLPEHR